MPTRTKRSTPKSVTISPSMVLSTIAELPFNGSASIEELTLHILAKQHGLKNGVKHQIHRIIDNLLAHHTLEEKGGFLQQQSFKPRKSSSVNLPATANALQRPQEAETKRPEETVPIRESQIASTRQAAGAPRVSASPSSLFAEKTTVEQAARETFREQLKHRGGINGPSWR